MINPEKEDRAPLLSACLIVRNEASFLPDCLEGLRGLADEIVVVDTGSTDGSQEVARRHGARLVQSSWKADFSSARNESLAAASGRWILVVDADERVPASQADRIRDLIARHTPPGGRPAAAFSLLQRSATAGNRTGMLVSIVRLFPNRPDVRYEWPIHEQVVTHLERVGLPVLPTDIEIVHLGYADPLRNLQKQRRNREILLAQVDGDGRAPVLAVFLLAGAHLDLGETEQALHRYRAAADRTDPESELGIGSRIRLATCLLKLNRAGEAVSALGSMGGGCAAHPEGCAQMGEALLGLGEAAGARAWFERTLDCGPAAYVPPCDHAAVRLRAMVGLAKAWDLLGRRDRSVFILRAARAAQQAQTEFSRGTLEEIYSRKG